MQAARGASLISSDPAQSPVPHVRRKRPLRLFALVALLGYAVDLGTKQLALTKLESGTPVPVIGDVVTFYLTSNSGAAFSLGTSYTLVLAWVAVAAAGLTVWYARRIGSTGWSLALGFLLAGILGNLTDRIVREPSPMRGHVIDFIKFPNFPVFNVADIFINVAAGLIILQTIRGIRLDGTLERTREKDDAPDRPDEGAGA